jgi:small-conductance mechanosensitive channel
LYQGVNYAGLSVINIKAIQEQQQKIERLKTAIITVEARYETLKISNKELEVQLAKMQEAIKVLHKNNAI